MPTPFSLRSSLFASALFVSFTATAQSSFQVTTAAASPSTVTAGQTVSLSASVESGSVVKNVIVDLEVYNPAGVKMAQTSYQSQSFQASQTAAYSLSFTVPSGTPAEKLTLMVGVFAAGWASDLFWDSSAAFFTVGPAQVAVNGVCGSSNAATLGSAPTANLCSSGTASTLSGSGPWSWSCTGINGGSTTSCSAALSASAAPTTSGASAGVCGMQLGGEPVVFCDTFDAPAGLGNGNRAGQLNGNVWGASRTIGDGVNFGQREYNQWNETTLDLCDGTTPTVIAPNDIVICNGQLREASNDNNSGLFENGTVTSLAMYPKQPFDFAGRTGTVSFDVSNDTGGIHSAWPEFWMTDLPVPGPFTHFGSWEALPANGFGVRLAGEVPAGQQGSCPNTNNISQIRWTVDSAVVVRGYVLDDTDGFGTRTAMNVTPLDCAIESSGPGQFNHVEIRISQNQIDVYATDAGVAATPATLKHIAVITNANLTLTRGLIWIEDVHYNADKGLDPARPSQRQHTFSWDNVAFDGPFTDRDFAYDAPDNTTPGANGSINLAQFSAANQTSTWNVPGLPANREAAAARVLFSFSASVNPNPTVLNVIVNGHATTVPWPYPDELTNSWRTYAVTIPLSDVVTGTNVIQLGGDAPLIFSNVDLVLGDVTGGVPVLPGNNDAYP